MPVSPQVRRVRRWFWVMVLVAAVAMGLLYRTIKAEPAPAVALLFLASAVVVLGAVVQAGRIWIALEGPVRLSRLRLRRRPGR